MWKGENRYIENSRGGWNPGDRGFLFWCCQPSWSRCCFEGGRVSFSPLLAFMRSWLPALGLASHMKGSSPRAVCDGDADPRGWKLWAILLGPCAKGGGCSLCKTTQRGSLSTRILFQQCWRHSVKNKSCSPETVEFNSISSQCVFIECLIQFR